MLESSCPYIHKMYTSMPQFHLLPDYLLSPAISPAGLASNPYNIKMFQVPSAQAFFKRAISTIETLSKFTWRNMQSKIRYLKTKYQSAVGWLQENCGEDGEDYAAKHGWSSHYT